MEFLPILKQNNVHVAMDTSLFTTEPIIRELLPYVDLWMVSIKHMDDEFHKQLTGVSNVQIQKNIELLDSLLTTKSLRIRYLLVPGITDHETNLTAMAHKLSQLKHLESLEILSYSDIGKFKWIELFGKYPLEGTPETTQKVIAKAKAILTKDFPEIDII
jgi:pyruvate formate lyase activating enzyme